MANLIEIKKRSQTERVAIALTILENIWNEVREGNAEKILQEMVYVQMFTNRIVWKLGEINNRRT
jgi:hypothetical protein